MSLAVALTKGSREKVTAQGEQSNQDPCFMQSSYFSTKSVFLDH